MPMMPPDEEGLDFQPLATGVPTPEEIQEATADPEGFIEMYGEDRFEFVMQYAAQQAGGGEEVSPPMAGLQSALNGPPEY